MRFSAACVAMAVLSGLVAPVLGDNYLHYPPGSNNRNREQSQNRDNANRLFDSQNNGAGGYGWAGEPGESTPAGTSGPLDTFYVGERVWLEWTNQHGCGPHSNTYCDIIVQYMCDAENPQIRDGYPTGDMANFDDTYPEYQYRQFQFNNDRDGTQRIRYATKNDNDGRTDTKTNSRNSENTATVLADCGLTNGDFTDPLDALHQYFYSATPAMVEECRNTVSNECTLVRCGIEYGVHESYEHYFRCSHTQRNLGLWWADRSRRDYAAVYTRQNNNGNRHAFECPEERDYYPYWRGSPWRDIVIMPGHIEECDYYVKESQNVKSRYRCSCDENGDDFSEASKECRLRMAQKLRGTNQGTNYDGAYVMPITKEECTAIEGFWLPEESFGLDEPDCMVHPLSRDNHLGNAFFVDVNGKAEDIDDQGPPATAGYWWEVPEDMADKNCILRIRYNITTGDVPHKAHIPIKGKEDEAFIWDKSKNCKGGEPNCPVYQDPYVRVDDSLPRISVALNTNQIGRVFQDRSHIFQVKSRNKADKKCRSGKLWSLSCRGRRGNIVQAYPSVEYDFTPNPLYVGQDECIHIHFSNKMFNQNNGRNNAAGFRYSDAQNILQLQDLLGNIPVKLSDSTLFPELKDAQMAAFGSRDPHADLGEELMFEDMPQELQNAITNNNIGQIKAALSNNPSIMEQYKCLDLSRASNDAAEEFPYWNCGKLNQRPAVFEMFLKVDNHKTGEYYYASTRNNNFSNRSQKGQIVVNSNFKAVLGVVAGGFGVLALGAIGFFGASHYASKHPDSGIANFFDNFGRRD
ncbi:MAG: hypothetical protein MHM6MM_000737 [Cercozoa sp. M6MM]